MYLPLNNHLSQTAFHFLVLRVLRKLVVVTDVSTAVAKTGSCRGATDCLKLGIGLLREISPRPARDYASRRFADCQKSRPSQAKIVSNVHIRSTINLRQIEIGGFWLL